MELHDKGSVEGDGGSVDVDHVETPSKLLEAPKVESEKLSPAAASGGSGGSGSAENSVDVADDEILLLEDKTNDEEIEDPDCEKSSGTKRKYDEETGLLSPVKRRQRNIEIRKDAIEKFEDETTEFVWDYLSANYAEKFPSAGSIYEFSVRTVKQKILPPEVNSYSKVIEQGGSWADFQLNRAMKENVQRYLEELM